MGAIEHPQPSAPPGTVIFIELFHGARRHDLPRAFHSRELYERLLSIMGRDYIMIAVFLLAVSFVVHRLLKHHWNAKP